MLEPKVGTVVRYDFLWKADADKGLDQGKDRPCAIILARKQQLDGSFQVLLCPITHSPPSRGQTAVELPAKVTKHLGLDDQPCWLKTDQVNQLRWEQGRIPYGLQPVAKDKWSYGELPQALGQKAVEQVRNNARQKQISHVDREQEAHEQGQPKRKTPRSPDNSFDRGR